VQLRFDDILAQRTPSDPYLVKPSARPHPGAEPVGG
jgi:hypothetical protein